MKKKGIKKKHLCGFSSNPVCGFVMQKQIKGRAERSISLRLILFFIFSAGVIFFFCYLQNEEATQLLHEYTNYVRVVALRRRARCTHASTTKLILSPQLCI